jgi:PPP family 3-phenylpropionic acid transporter
VSIGRLRAIFALQGLAQGSLLPFLVPLLAGQGMQPSTIGLVLSAAAFVSLISFPVWGVLADGPVGRERSIVITSLIAALAGVAILASGSDAVLLGLAAVAVSLGIAPWGPVTDALALQALGDGAPAYGRLRRWASAGWAASALAGGAIYAVSGPAVVVLGFVVASLLVALLALGRHDGPIRVGRAPRMRARRFLDRAAMRRALRASPVLLPFLVALFVESMGNSAAASFVSLRILDQGGGTVLIGLAAAIPAIIEVPFFSASSWFTRRMGLRLLFVIGSGVAAIELMVVAVAPTPGIVTIARAVDGGAFALRYAGAVLIVGACLPSRLRAVGQSLLWFVAAGLAPIVADTVGGVIYQSWGGPTLFAVCSLAAAGGALLGYAVLSGPQWGRPVSVPSVLDPGPGSPYL